MIEVAKGKRMRQFSTYRDLMTRGSLQEKKSIFNCVKDIDTMPLAQVSMGFDLLKSKNGEYYIIEVNGSDSGLGGFVDIMEKELGLYWKYGFTQKMWTGNNVPSVDCFLSDKALMPIIFQSAFKNSGGLRIPRQWNLGEDIASYDIHYSEYWENYPDYVVVKPRFGAQGFGVKVVSKKTLFNTLCQPKGRYFLRGCIAQEYIEPETINGRTHSIRARAVYNLYNIYFLSDILEFGAYKRLGKKRIIKRKDRVCNAIVNKSLGAESVKLN